MWWAHSLLERADVTVMVNSRALHDGFLRNVDAKHPTHNNTDRLLRDVHGRTFGRSSHGFHQHR